MKQRTKIIIGIVILALFALIGGYVLSRVLSKDNNENVKETIKINKNDVKFTGNPVTTGCVTSAVIDEDGYVDISALLDKNTSGTATIVVKNSNKSVGGYITAKISNRSDECKEYYTVSAIPSSASKIEAGGKENVVVTVTQKKKLKDKKTCTFKVGLQVSNEEK